MLRDTVINVDVFLSVRVTIIPWSLKNSLSNSRGRGDHLNSRLDYQPLFGKGARSPLTRERRKSSLYISQELFFNVNDE